MALLFPAICLAQDVHQPKTTSEILKKIASSKKQALWQKITDIPVFTPKYHSDGCSGGMSAIYAKLKFLHNKLGKTLPWRQCCVIHDKAYYYGGSRKLKKKADEALKQCVSKTVGNENLGLILGMMMKDAVWVGGVPYFPTSYRWSYGEDFRGTKGLPIR